MDSKIGRLKAMAVFAIVSLSGSNTAKIDAALLQHYPDKFIKADEGHWLLADQNGTAQSVSQRLGLLDPPEANPSAAVVYNIARYFARAPNHVWEWLSANFGARP